MTRAMILAAGLGTRLGGLSDERPKPLLPVADVPLVRYAIALCAGHGIREIVVNLHHHGDMIADLLGDGARLGVHIAYSREQAILGTGGGIRRALPLLGDGPFFVINGKIVFEVDLGAVLARHVASGAAATLVVRPDPDAARWGAIDAPSEGGSIRALLGVGAHMFTGVQVLEPELVARLPDDDTQRCIVRQGYVPWLDSGVALEAYVAPGYFMEHSTPERYLLGNLNVIRGLASLTYPPGPLVGVDPSAEVHPEAQINPPVRIGHGARIGAYAIVGPDVVVGAYADVGAGIRLSRTVVWPKTKVRQDADGSIMTPTQRVRLAIPPRE
jgi:NDP-sugar pyrophosphorylase family protein